MNNSLSQLFKVSALSTTIILTASCSVSPTKPDGAVVMVRQKLSTLQNNQNLASRAQVAIKEAETATRLAEQPEKDQQLLEHRIFMADHKVDIALSIAQSRMLEEQRHGLNEQRDKARLDSRTEEVNAAQNNMHSAQREMHSAKEGMLSAREDMMISKKHNAELEQQLAALNAKKSDRGMVLTMGDLLFAFGKSDLESAINVKLDKLSMFLDKYPERQVIIEGYTDNVGSDEYNLKLSKERANSVQSYLLDKGIAKNRMTTSGKGNSAPIATNDSKMGRQLNRRVEIIISNIEMADIAMK